jgi:hypothetical protein
MHGPLNVREDQYMLSITVPSCPDMETVRKQRAQHNKCIYTGDPLIFRRRLWLLTLS